MHAAPRSTSIIIINIVCCHFSSVSINWFVLAVGTLCPTLLYQVSPYYAIPLALTE
ncbi:hypothetical protein P152DRAFT_462421 [Eremomyces bilateralis CBS 781.70]|uniref:Uncharacterized protein n=1 Tax=Eremomyces bilateralis CBS 781.70 TaxID=1392243 RepID=A0A6G1FRS8_9PEZI|nr:uncharacterized protein P152DRAFT_462421 [Eremomyces bilateralis CBS 781.70]KAF1808555.1 hypothetical protein P152DRAFT_462421 [Eremomyces bilateralis CBS 781.70]